MLVKNCITRQWIAAASRRSEDKEQAMSDLVDTILAHLGDPQIAQIAAQLGTTPEQARDAINHALPLIIGGMARNASTPQGADALHNALGDHAGQDISAILGNVLGGGGGSGIGGAILGHIFGGNQGAANQGLGHVTGLGEQGAGQLMAVLAPIVMGILANRTVAQGMGPGGLGGMLGQQSQQMQQQGGLVGGLLNAVLGHGGGNLDLSGLGGLLSGLGQR
jgi:hypothetical protein